MELKPAVKYPKKNLFTLAGATLTTGGGSSLNVISPNELIVYSGTNPFTAAKTANIKVKPNTQYTISYLAERVNSVDVLRVSPRKVSDGSGITLSDGEGSKTLTFNTGSETEITFLLYANLTVATSQSNRYSKIQLEEGSVATPFEPYELGAKPAILYPKNNLFTKAWVPNRLFDGSFPAEGYDISANGDTITVNKSGATAMVSQKVTVKPNTNYTLSYENDSGIDGGWYIYNPAGVLLDFGVRSNLRTINSGSNTSLIIGLFKGSSYNASPSIKFYKVVLLEGVSTNPYELGMKQL
jgi:hypothetical protein